MDAPSRWFRASGMGALAALGCAGVFTPVEKQPDFGQYFTISLPGGTEQARLEGTRLYGSDLEVSRLEGGFLNPKN